MTDLTQLSAREARRLIGNREISARELVAASIARIEAVDPVLNAMVARSFDRAVAEAEAADKAVASGSPLGPLHGLPIAVKDLTDAEGLPTTFGSPLFADNIAKTDAKEVADLRAAGAIVVGKTNTPEWGAGGNTFNPVYGVTGNPFDPAKTCSGSSGGTAVALATGMVQLATGSDFGGSVRTPAAYCGVVGFRPSPGVIANPKRERVWYPYPVAGPMARTIDDAALMLSVTAGQDRRDPMSLPIDRFRFRDLPPVDLCGLRVGLSEDLGFAKVDPGIRETFRKRTAALASVFQSCAEVDFAIPDAGHVFEVIRGHYFVGRYAGMLERNPDKVGPLVTANLRFGETLTLADVISAEQRQAQISQAYQALFDDIDVLIVPTVPVPPFDKDVHHLTEIEGQPVASYMDQIALTYGMTLTTAPIAAIPCGFDHTGMPFGFQIAGPKGGDLQVLAIAHALETYMADAPDLARPIPDLALLGA